MHSWLYRYTPFLLILVLLSRFQFFFCRLFSQFHLWIALIGLAIPVIGGNGGLFLNSQPPGALIYINRYYQNQVTPARVGTIDLGSDRTIEVSLKLMGYEIKTLKIELENEFDIEDIVLEPIKSQVGDELNLPNQTIAKQQIPDLSESGLEETKKLLLQAVNLIPTADTHYYLGLIFGNQLQWQNAIDHLKKSISLNSSDPKTFSKLGEAYLVGLAQAQTAIPILKKALQISPQHVLANQLLGQAYLRLNQYQLAVEHLTIAVKLDKNNVISNYHLGFSYYQQEKFSVAVPFFNKVIEMDSLHRKAHFSLGNCYFRMGKMKKAKDAFSIFQQLRQEEETIKILDHYLSNESTPRKSEADNLQKWNQLINLLIKHQRWLEAITTLKNVQRITDQTQDAERPNYTEALGSIYIKTRDYFQAIKLYRELVKIKPNYSEYHHILGIAYLATEDYISAIDYFQIAILLKPNQANYYLDLAHAYQKIGNTSKADLANHKYQILINKID